MIISDSQMPGLAALILSKTADGLETSASKHQIPMNDKTDKQQHHKLSTQTEKVAVTDQDFCGQELPMSLPPSPPPNSPFLKQKAC